MKFSVHSLFTVFYYLTGEVTAEFEILKTYKKSIFCTYSSVDSS